MPDLAPALSTAPTEDQLRVAWRWIAEDSYWGAQIPWNTFRRACAGSHCFALVVDAAPIAFARVVSDGATFAWLCDVFVDRQVRGRGVGKALMQAIMDDPRLQNLRRWGLATADAHDLYARYGFEPADPLRHMERVDRDIYPRLSSTT